MSAGLDPDGGVSEDHVGTGAVSQGAGCRGIEEPGG
jgi:hypothetical protein